MTAIILPGRRIRRDFKPDFPVKINWSNPLSRGLIGAYIPGINGSRDLTELNPTPTVSLNATIALTERGRVLRCAAATPGGIDLNTPAPGGLYFFPDSSEQWSVVCGVTYGATGGTIFTKTNNNLVISFSSSFDPQIRLRNTVNDANLGFNTNSGYHVLSVAWDGAAAAAYGDYNGINNSLAVGTTTKNTTTNAFAFASGVDVGSGDQDGHFLLLYNRPLSRAEHRELYAHPYQILSPLRRRTVVMLGSGDVTVDADAQFQADWRASLATDAAMPTEALTAARTDHAPAIDWLALIRGDRSAPVGWRSALNADQSAQSDWTSAINTDQAIQADNLAMLDRPAIVQVSWLSGARADRSISADWLAATRQDAAIPMEWSGTLLITGDAALPAEWRQAVSIDAALSADARALIQADQAAPIENLATIRAEAQSVIESLARIARDAAMPLEWSGGLLINADAPMPVEWRQALAADAAIPVDRAQIIVTDQSIPAEFKAGVISDQGAVLDWLASIRSDAAVPAEWKSVAVIQADAAIPVEWGGVAAFVAGNINVFHIDARGTVWRIPARGIIWRG